MAFTHLHLHTEYSLLDGACRIAPLVQKVKSLGQSAVAITDHGVMYGAVDFYKAAKAEGIKPIIGCEVYVAPRSRHDKTHGIDSERYHLVLLCENQIGYRNLTALVSEGFTTGFYTKPRVDKALLEEHCEGLIALSACLGGEVSQNLLKGDYAGAKAVAQWYRDTFGPENYFIELQNHNLAQQERINPQLMRIAREIGVKCVATNDAHYLTKEDAKVQQILICIGTNHILGEKTGLDFETDEFYVKSETEMREAFGFCTEAVENTQLIADRCNLEFEFGNTKLPHFEVPNGIEHFTWFSDMCHRGLSERYGDNTPEAYRQRLEYELDVIHRMGYVDYYLIVHDFIRHAKQKGIPVGPGRGSGAASICAYCIGITGIDPMKYNLLFERFLNPERVSMPDFDIDFCYERRQEVIDYVVEKYGGDHVAQIVTFGTLGAKAALRDVGRVMGIAYSTVDRVAKQIPRKLNITLEEALKLSPDFRATYEAGGVLGELIETARKVEGMPRNTSTHAAGVVITRDPVVDYVPLALNDDTVVTQYTMTTLEELGLLKMDFLGLRTLTVIKDTEKMIQAEHPDFSVEKINIDDPKVFDVMCSAQTEGIFQFESGGMRSVLAGLSPRTLEDMIAVISLYRPGPMDSIPTYIRNRHNPRLVQYKTPALKGILDVTYGCIVYQEQVMQICRELAGYSYGRADLVRRAMAKKKHAVMMQEREIFIHGLTDEQGNITVEGAVRRGVPEAVANSVFDEMASFASYAFNKAHAAAYAYVAYQTAWLKTYYPAQFLAATLTSFLDRTDKVTEYIAECQRLGITVSPPNVNESFAHFTVEGNRIMFGLLAIKNLGYGMIDTLVRERRGGGEFKGFFEFCRRMQGRDFNRRAVESLIQSGALDCLGRGRRQMLLALPNVMDELENDRRRNLDGQVGFFDLLSGQSAGTPSLAGDDSRFFPKGIDEFPVAEKLRLEKEITGLYLSGHPMSEYVALAEKLHTNRIAELVGAHATVKDNEKVTVLCMITEVKKKITKKDEYMAFLTAEDVSGSAEVIVFPRTMAENQSNAVQGAVVLLHGRMSLREEEEPKIIAELLEPCPREDDPNFEKYILKPATPPKPVKDTNGGKITDETKGQNNTPKCETNEPKKKQRSGLFLKFDSAASPQIAECEKLLSVFDGRVPLYYYFADKKEYKQFGPSYGIDVNGVLLRELRKLLGESNVIYNP